MGSKRRSWLIDKVNWIKDPGLYELLAMSDTEHRYRVVYGVIHSTALRCARSSVPGNFESSEATAKELIDLMLIGVDDCVCSKLLDGENEVTACVAKRAGVAMCLYTDLRQSMGVPYWGEPKRALLAQVAKAWSWAAKGKDGDEAKEASKRLFSFLLEVSAGDSRMPHEPKLVSEVIRANDAACELWQIQQAIELIVAWEKEGPFKPCRPLIESLMVGLAKRIDDAGFAAQAVNYLTKLLSDKR